MDRRIRIYLTNRREYFQNGVLMGTWVKLPVPEEELESVLESIGVEGHNTSFQTTRLYCLIYISANTATLRN